MCDLLKPPECVRAMLYLDKEKFNKTIHVPCIRFALANSSVSPILKCLKKYMLKMEKFKPVETKTENNISETCVYLTPALVKVWLDIEETDRKKLEKANVSECHFTAENELTLKYENFSAIECLKAILPVDQEGLASFTKIGHIVHINLRDHLLLYKDVIGAVLLDKVAGCKSVVNKVNNICNKYRNFEMELLAGENDMMTKVKENRCNFEFNFSTVFWNSRLSTEHERIVCSLREGEVLFDVFAGVGPFSVPAAKRKVIVYANDLNPESFNWLNHNIKINKIDKRYIKTFNKDGRDFILEDMKENLIKYSNYHKVHIIMNLPALAAEFLPIFHKLYTPDELKEELVNIPHIYLYCFTKGEDFVALAKSIVLTNMGWDISEKILDISKVRTVSSYKDMVKVIIKLDRDILVGCDASKAGLKRKLDDSNSVVESEGPQDGKKQATQSVQNSRSEEPEAQVESKDC